MTQTMKSMPNLFAASEEWSSLWLCQQNQRLRLRSNCAALVAYAAEHFSEFATPDVPVTVPIAQVPAMIPQRNSAVDPLPIAVATSTIAAHVGERTAPEICVNVLWIEPDDFDPVQHTFSPTDTMNRIGRRIYSSENLLLWLAPFTIENLQYRFQLEGSQLTVDAIYHFAPTPGKSAKELAAKRIRKFFSLMKHLLIYPLSWYLEHFEQKYLLHASAVRHRHQALAIAGVGGVGKTTTCLALFNQPDTQLMAENLVYYDHHQLYSCYEPIRVDAQSLQLLGTLHPALMRGQLLPTVKEKAVYHLPRAQVAESARLGAFFLPRFAAETRLLPIEPALAVDKLLAMNMQTREINAYYWFAATLALVWPQAEREFTRADYLKRLLQDAPLYEVAIQPNGQLQRIVELIYRGIDLSWR